MRTSPILLALLSLPTSAAALNDTGQTNCYNGTAMVTCSLSNTGDAAPYPRQDGRFGRDAAQQVGQLAAKTGGGEAGFDFSPLDASGNAIAIVGGIPSSTPLCVRDNVTQLIWEVKTANNYSLSYTWFDATLVYASSVNTAALCSFKSGWRLPTRRELLSIVHHGAINPAIDTHYFPNTWANDYWTSDMYALDPNYTWTVNFYSGGASVYGQNFSMSVRLVRSAP